jgi:hypothetical protein
LGRGKANFWGLEWVRRGLEWARGAIIGFVGAFIGFVGFVKSFIMFRMIGFVPQEFTFRLDLRLGGRLPTPRWRARCGAGLADTFDLWRDLWQRDHTSDSTVAHWRKKCGGFRG